MGDDPRDPNRGGSFLKCERSAAAGRCAQAEIIWCPLDPKPLSLNYRQEEEVLRGDYNLRGCTPKADVDVWFTP